MGSFQRDPDPPQRFVTTTATSGTARRFPKVTLRRPQEVEGKRVIERTLAKMRRYYVEHANRLERALTDPFRALKNEKCASLFKQSPGGLSPTELLMKLASGTTSYGFFTLDKITPAAGTTTSATMDVTGFKLVDIDGGQQLVPSAVKITINLGAGSFQTGTTDDRMVTVLHELGHAFYALFGPGSSSIVPDGGDIANGTEVSMSNTALVREKCL